MSSDIFSQIMAALGGKNWLDDLTKAVMKEFPQVQCVELTHDGKPQCGNTLVSGEAVKLLEHGLLPVRCAGCGELLTDCEDA